MRVVRILGKVAAWTIGVCLALLLAVLVLRHDASRAVIHNLTETKFVPADMASWKKGAVWTHVPYAEDSKSQYVDIYVPTDVLNPPLLVLVHGGDFLSGDTQSPQTQRVVEFFRDHGFACASVNYRLAEEAAFPAAICDVKACIRFLHANAEKYGYSREHTALWGEGSGGYLALMSAVTRDEDFLDVHYTGEEANWEHWVFYSSEVESLVDFCGFEGPSSDRSADWKELKIPQPVIAFFNPDAPQVPEGYSDGFAYWMRGESNALSASDRRQSDPYVQITQNAEQVGKLRVWISHGEVDLTAPWTESQRLSDALKENARKVRFDLVEGAGHYGNSLYEDGHLKLIASFLREK